MEPVELLVFLAVGFIVGKNWTRLKAFVQSTVADVRKK